MSQIKVGVLVGSLSKVSNSRKVAQGLISVAPAQLSLELVEIGDLPLYNYDLDTDGVPAPQWTRFRGQIKNFDALIFITPEYNRSTSAVLKNAVDVGSRPYTQNAFNGKPAGVVSQSMGNIGGFAGASHLRQSLVAVNLSVMAQPEAYLASAHTLFDEKGAILQENTKEFLRSWLESFQRWSTTNLKRA